MSCVWVQIINQFDRNSHEYRAAKYYWKLIQQDSRKLSDKRFYRPTFRIHLINREILDKLLIYPKDLKDHYDLYQFLLFHFEDKLKQVRPLFQTIFETFIKGKEKNRQRSSIALFQRQIRSN